MKKIKKELQNIFKADINDIHNKKYFITLLGTLIFGLKPI